VEAGPTGPLPAASGRHRLGLADRGIGFQSLQEAIDTTTPGGKLVFHVFAALAEFERDLIRERTATGLEAARARDGRGGRRRS
jgi:DNA invertase Pin-like site-specific DNA recombinase